jgi:hypothetical protein
MNATKALIWPLACLAAACAGDGDRPTADIERAAASIESAEKTGGRQFGAVELDDAQEKLTLARTKVESGEMNDAERLAEQAVVDAELAGAKGATGKSNEALTELQEGIATLREELERQPVTLDRQPTTGVETTP